MKKNALPNCRGNEQNSETCSDSSLTSEGNLASRSPSTWQIGSDSETDEINRNEDESGDLNCESNKCSEMTEFVDCQSLSTHARLFQRRHTLQAKRNSSFEGCAPPGCETQLGGNGAPLRIGLHSSVTRSASFDQNSRCGGYGWLLLKVILVKIPAMLFSEFLASSTFTESIVESHFSVARMLGYF